MATDEGGEAVATPITNGELHPPSDDTPTLSTPGKRKRASTPEESSAPVNHSSAVSLEQTKEELDQTLRYLLQILARSVSGLLGSRYSRFLLTLDSVQG
jgi:hypothetical protein